MYRYPESGIRRSGSPQQLQPDPADRPHPHLRGGAGGKRRYGSDRRAVPGNPEADEIGRDGRGGVFRPGFSYNCV